MSDETRRAMRELTADARASRIETIRLALAREIESIRSDRYLDPEAESSREAVRRLRLAVHEVTAADANLKYA